MEKKFDIIALGEYLVDFSPSGIGAMGNPLYEMNPGGAPTNCLAACANLGGKTGLIGAVGDDLFGRFLKGKLEIAGIDAAGLQTVPVNTTLVFVALQEGGEREFAFVRDPGADTQIRIGSTEKALLENTKFFHFGSLSLTDEPARTATEFAVEYARAHGATISYDPNYRQPLWKDENTAIARMLWGIRQADFVKLSEEELELIMKTDIEEGAAKILSMGVKELYVTAGSKGAYYFTQESRGFVPGFEVQAVDTTGCGDAFTGAILYQSCHTHGRSVKEKTVVANAVGALCAGKPGGICAMPNPEELHALLRKNNIGCEV